MPVSTRSDRAWCLCALVAMCGSSLAAPPSYDMQILPDAAAPFNTINAYELGAQGQVVGRLTNFGQGLMQGFVFQGGALTLLSGLGGVPCEARCIDDNGVVYGGSLDTRLPASQLKMIAVRWVGGVPEALDPGVAGNTSFIFGCSPTTGAAVGWTKPFAPGEPGWRGEFGYADEFDFSASGDPVRAWLWRQGQSRMVAKGLGLGDDRATDINDAGQIAISLNTTDDGGAALFDPRFGLLRLPDLGSDASWTFTEGINSAGDIVGVAMGIGRREHPVMWRAGRCIDLGLMPGTSEGRAWDINNAGVIVGGFAPTTFDFGVRPTIGAVSFESQWHNLNALVTPVPGFTIHDAIAINDAGQILVVMNPPPLSPTRYAVLTPRP